VLFGNAEYFNRPLSGYEGFVVRARDNREMLLDGNSHNVGGVDRFHGDPSRWVSQRLRSDPILAIGAVIVTSEHAKAKCLCPWQDMEEWFLFNRVDGETGNIAKWGKQVAISIEADMTNTFVARGDFASMAARQAPDPMIVHRLYQLSLRSMSGKDIGQMVRWGAHPVFRCISFPLQIERVNAKYEGGEGMSKLRARASVRYLSHNRRV
jgi:hypothetical protein